MVVGMEIVVRFLTGFFPKGESIGFAGATGGGKEKKQK